MNPNSNHKLLLALITAAIPATMWARTRTDAEMAASATSILRKAMAAPGHGATLPPVSLVERKAATALYSDGERGFAVVSTDDLLPEVLGYSETPIEEAMSNPHLEWWMRAIEDCGNAAIASGVAKTMIPPYGSYESSVDAMCTTQWDQDKPYNCKCPTGTSSGNNWQGYYGTGTCVTGCVATAMAQVLNYHKAPVSGIGTHSVQVRQEGGHFETFTADFGNAVYDWDHMLDSYPTGGYTQQEAEAVGLLMYHCGVATDMEYATDGSGAYMQDCRDGLVRNFGFEQATLLGRNSYSEADWMEYVYNEINSDRPIIYAGDDMVYRAGHCFVLDGYDERGRVHINWGWGGSGDGFFDIATLSVNGYSFSYYQEMVIGVEGTGSHVGYYNVDLQLEAAGKIAEALADTQHPLDSISSLTVQGPVNASDIEYIRAIGKQNILRKLDLHRAQFTELADSAFADCGRLAVVQIPRSVTKIGKGAFAHCAKLSEVRLYQRELPKCGSKMFDGVNLYNVRLSVPAECSTRFSRALQWRDFGAISEFGTAIVVRNLVREVGQPNPELTYNIIGDPIVGGEPVLTCEATIDSPAGRYTIHIEPGTIHAPDADFVDGYLVVTDSASGIEQLNNDDAQQSVMFNLQGQRVVGQSQGVSLLKGRKVVVK